MDWRYKNKRPDERGADLNYPETVLRVLLDYVNSSCTSEQATNKRRRVCVYVHRPRLACSVVHGG